MDENNSNFSNIYGQNLTFDIKKSNGYLRISISKNIPFMYYISAFLVLLINLLLLICSNTVSISLGLIILLYLTYSIINLVTTEELQVIKGFGYQIGQRSFIKENKTFIPYEKVQETFINEVIHKNRIIFLVSLLIKQENEMEIVPIFTGLIPRLNCLTIIYNELKIL